jgi:hypothetical protein
MKIIEKLIYSILIVMYGITACMVVGISALLILFIFVCLTSYLIWFSYWSHYFKYMSKLYLYRGFWGTYNGPYLEGKGVHITLKVLGWIVVLMPLGMYFLNK